MRVAFQIAIILSIALLLAASCGLALRLSGYVVAGAFGNIFRIPQDAAIHQELELWLTYCVASLGASIWLLLVYRKYKRTIWK